MLSVIRPSARDPLVGALLDGRYHVTGVLGRGGMGIVYEGLHQPLGRAVAIKVLGPNTASDPVVVARFLREARVASGLAHGNIVDVSDLGRLPDGRPYLVMPKVAGIDFATLLEREGPMPSARVANLLRGVAAALDLVHAKGLVHRDVKPENLMHVVRADGSETVMLLDFGIAALLAGNAARLTGDEMICGSPAYMAPELIASGNWNRRADVYALATVAFEMLAGRLPFDDELPMRVMMVKTAGSAPTLSSASDRVFSDDVERVIARGLARDPGARFASAGEFVASLTQAAGASDLAGEHVGAGAEPGQAPGAAFDSTRPAESVVTQARSRRMASVSVALVVAAGVLLLAWRLAPRPEPAVPPVESAAVRAAQVDPAVPAVVVEPPDPPAPEAPPEGVSPASVSAAEFAPQAEPPHPATVPRAPRPASQRLASNPTERLTESANRELLQGHLAHALELFQRALERDSHDLAALRGLGLAQEHLGRSGDAVRTYRKALALEPNASLAPQIRERLERLGAK